MNASTLATLMIFALLTAGAAVLWQQRSGVKMDQALDELTAIMDKSSRAAFSSGAGNITNFSKLVDRGYMDSNAYSDGDNENVYGNDITAIGSAATNTIAIKYTTDKKEQCNFLLDHIDDRFDGIVGTPGCDTSQVLSVTVSAVRQ